MNPIFLSQQAGRAGSPLRYGLKDRVMPAPPHHAKEIHDLVDLESMADPLGKRPAKWNKSTASEVFRRFSRDAGHRRVDNICTLEQHFNDPDLKKLQCWYFPRPASAKNPEKPAKFFKAAKSSELAVREDMWGAWNISVELETAKTRRHNLRRSTRDDLQNSENYFETHIESVAALQEIHRRGRKPCKDAAKVDLLKRRKGDIEAVHSLV